MPAAICGGKPAASSSRPDGLPAVNSRPVPPAVRAVRLLRVGLHLAWGAGVAALLFPWVSQQRRKREIRRWSARLLHLLAVKLRVHGASRPDHAVPLMLVANHVSWLDIFAINAVLPARFVAKSEVRRWPLIGWLCDRTGTLFIERSRRSHTVRINRLIAQALQAGDTVALFPEATSTDGTQVRKFHSALLQPATQVRAMLQPVAIRYRRADGSPCVEAAYDGDKSLWSTLRTMLSQRAIYAELHFLPPLSACGQTRRALAGTAHGLIARALFPSSGCSRTA